MSFGLTTFYNNYKPSGGGSYPIVAQNALISDSGNNCGATETLSFGSTPTNGSLIILAVSDNTGLGPTSFTGFTLLAGGTDRLRVFYKIASAELNAYSYIYFGVNSGDATMMQGLNITGNFSTPIDTYTNSVNTATTPSITTSQTFELILSIGGSFAGVGSWTTLIGYTAGIRHDSVNGGAVEIGSAYLNKPTAGATGTATWAGGAYTAANVYTIGVRSV